MDSNLMAETSTVVMPLVATPWATPVRPMFGTARRDWSAVSSMHLAHQGYGAGGSMSAIAALGSAANGPAVTKQVRPPREVPR